MDARPRTSESFDVLVVDDEEDNLDAFRFAFRSPSRSTTRSAAGRPRRCSTRLDAGGHRQRPAHAEDERHRAARRAKERRPDAVGILLTAYADLDVLVDAVNSGAVERYVQKPWDSKELTAILRQAIKSFATVRENKRLREQLALYAGYLEREQRDPIDFGEIAGESALMKEVLRAHRPRSRRPRRPC
jgi:two-component system response regulator AtoC